MELNEACITLIWYFYNYIRVDTWYIYGYLFQISFEFKIKVSLTKLKYLHKIVIKVENENLIN